MRFKKLISGVIAVAMAATMLPAGAVSVSAASWENTLVAHYDFASGLPAGSEPIADNGSNASVTVSAPVLTVDSQRGQVLSIQTGIGANGTDVANKSASYLRLTNPYTDMTLTGATVSYWVKSSEDYGVMAGFDLDWGFAIADATPYVMYNTASGYFDGHATSAIPSGEWAMVTMTVDSSNGITLYVNGEAIGYSQSGAATIANVLDTLSNAYYATVGFVYSPYLSSRGGLYDDFYYFNSALSAADVAQMYADTQPTATEPVSGDGDYTTGLLAHYDFASGLPSGSEAIAHNGTNVTNPVSAPTLTTDSARGQVLSIQTGEGAGANDDTKKSASYLRLANPYSGLSLTGATVSFWVNSDEAYGVMAGFDLDWGFAIADETPYVMYNTAAGYFDGHATASIPTGEWAMVTMTVDSSNGISVYINGIKVAYSQSGAATIANVLDTLSNAYYATVGFVYSPYLGSRGGLYDDFYYYNRALEDADVLALYNATIATAASNDKAALNAALTTANAIDQSLYTADSLVALNAAILVGQTVYADDDATDTDIANAISAINSAISALVLIADSNVPSDGLLAHYDFASGLPSGSEAIAHNGTNVTNPVSAPTLTTDSARGQVLSIQTGEGAGANDDTKKSASYLRLANPYSGLSLTGATVSFWVNSDEAYGVMAGFDLDWGFAIADETPYVMYNTAAGYFDGHATTAIPSGEWAMVTMTVDSSNGISVYINGIKVAYSQSGAATIANVLDTLSNAYYATIGFVYSPYLGSRGGLYDDIYYYSKALNASEVLSLYNAAAGTATVDKSALATALAEANAIDQTLYTADSLVDLNAAILLGETTYNDDDATQDDVDEATAAINDAIGNLEEVVAVDKTELATLLATANAIDQSLYTADSASNLAAAIMLAQATYDAADTTQDDVDVAMAALETAIAGLVAAQVDKTDLEALITTASGYTLNTYTTPSANALTSAIAAAQAVVDNANATQAEVDAAEAALQSAIDGLVSLPARLRIASMNLALGSDLTVNYSFDKSLFADGAYTNGYIVFTRSGSDAEYVVTIDDWTTYSQNTSRYAASFKNLAPYAMNETITAVLYGTYDGVEYASSARQISVVDYATNMINSASSNDKTKTMMVDLLNYGAAAQTYVGYDTDNLANANLTADQAAYGTADTPELTDITNNKYATIDNATVKWRGVSLSLYNNISIKWKIEASSIDNLIIKITNENGTVLEELTAEDLELEAGYTNRYSFLYSGLTASEMSKPVFVTVYENGVAVSNTFRYSIESYAAANQNAADTKLANMVVAMMKYGNSAYAFAH